MPTLSATHTLQHTHSHLSRHLSQGLCNPPAVAIFEPQRLFFVELLQATLRAAGQVAKCCSSNSSSDGRGGSGGSSSFKMQMHLTPVGQLFVAISRMQQTHSHTRNTHCKISLLNFNWFAVAAAVDASGNCAAACCSCCASCCI